MVRNFTVATAAVYGRPDFVVFIERACCVQSPFDLTPPVGGWTLSNMPGFNSEAALVDEVQQRLVRKFSHVPKDQISTTVAQAHARFEDSRIRDFVPLLVERRARAALAELTEPVATPA
jgi:hypothetical protein